MKKIACALWLTALAPALGWAQSADAPPPPRIPAAAEAARVTPPAAPIRDADAKPRDANADAGGAAPALPGAAPLPAGGETYSQARIEQKRQGNRVAEIIVTPAGANYSYVIRNREGQRPLSPLELSAGLSTPRFLKIDF